jgi:hypothetical protein
MPAGSQRATAASMRWPVFTWRMTSQGMSYRYGAPWADHRSDYPFKMQQNRQREFALSTSMRTQVRAEIVEWNAEPLWQLLRKSSC